MRRAVLLTSSPDRPGLVAAIAGAITGAGLNIVDVDSHLEVGWFHQRVEVEPDRRRRPGRRPARRRRSSPGSTSAAHGCARIPARRCRRRCSSRGRRTAPPTCWPAPTPARCRSTCASMVSNHPDLAPLAARWDVPFVHDRRRGRGRRGRRGAGAELVVLARYMRVLSPELCDRWAGRAINIHHSFLPAFVGADPYRRAHERGVKMIGATAHYVTAELDAGPIIAQDTARVSHRDTVDELRRRGAELERRVLADAVRLHVDDRVVVAGDRTVVFDH